jgi:hypothetical protein
MVRKPKYYRICSCGAKLSPYSRDSIKRHREMGHTLPMQKYDYKTGDKIKSRKY